MKSKNLALIFAISTMCILTACGSSNETETLDNTTSSEISTNEESGKDTINDGSTVLGTDYEDGTYRGFYIDGDINQVSIEFVLKDQKFESINYRALAYKDQDYLDEGATDVVKAVRTQFQEAADALIGKSVSDINILYNPGDIVKDIDTVTGATLRSGKLISALWDGLNRHPYKLP